MDLLKVVLLLLVLFLLMLMLLVEAGLTVKVQLILTKEIIIFIIFKHHLMEVSGLVYIQQ